MRGRTMDLAIPKSIVSCELKQVVLDRYLYPKIYVRL